MRTSGGMAGGGGGADGGETESIHCFGDANEILTYKIGQMRWEKQQFDNNAALDGSLRYSSVCALPDKKMLLTGGCLISNNLASSAVFEIHV